MPNPKTPKPTDSLATQPPPESFPSNAPPEPPHDAVKAPEAAELAEPPPAPEPTEPERPHDVEGVTTTVIEPPPDAPRRVRVWEGEHSAEAVILRVNEDATLDLSADLWGNNQPITLYGVKRRNGSGNGYEEIEPMDEKQAEAARLHNTEDDTRAGKAPSDLVTLRSEVAFNGTLQIDHSTYEVKDGVVVVPPWHVDAARAAGYR